MIEDHGEPRPGPLPPSAEERRANGAAKVRPIRPEINPNEIVFKRGDHVEIADRTLEKLGPHPLTYDVGDIWRYAPPLGIWERIEGHEVRTVVTSFAGAPCVSEKEPSLRIGYPTAKGAEKIIHDRLMSVPGRIAFGHAPPGMAFSNGFVTVSGGKVSTLPHSSMHLARTRYDFAYAAGATHPRLDKFLGELFADVKDELERTQRIALIQEFFGICLIGEATRYQRYLVMFARGGNGKSELLRVARAMFPAGTVTSLEPQLWRDQRAAAALEGVRANFVDELPDDEIMGGANVKRIITGEPLTARRVYEDSITFTPRAGHIFATNVEIQSTDYSDGFWERPLVLVLSRKFRQDPTRVLEASKGIIEAELPAIVAWAIEGAARAQRQGGYTEPGSSRATLLEWRDDNDQVRGFALDRPITGKWSAHTLYEEYKEWAKKNGCATMSSAKFGRRIVACGLAKRLRDASGRHYLPPGDEPVEPWTGAAQT